jgi:hypothetical protein
MASRAFPRWRRALVATFVAAAVAIPLVIAPNASAAKSRFGVVVVHENGSTSEECVTLNADKIRALDLLNRTAFDLYTQSFGGDLGRAICWLDGEGVGPPGCFGAPEDPFWGFYLQSPGEDPESTSLGVSSQMVRARDVVYFQFETFPQPTPERTTLRSICTQ